MKSNVIPIKLHKNTKKTNTLFGGSKLCFFSRKFSSSEVGIRSALSGSQMHNIISSVRCITLD